MVPIKNDVKKKQNGLTKNMIKCDVIHWSKVK